MENGRGCKEQPSGRPRGAQIQALIQRTPLHQEPSPTYSIVTGALKPNEELGGSLETDTRALGTNDVPENSGQHFPALSLHLESEEARDHWRRPRLCSLFPR